MPGAVVVPPPAASPAAPAAPPAAPPLRVLLVVDALEGGGAERYVADLALALHDRAHDVAVACSVAGALGEPLVRAGVEVLPLRPALVKRRVSPAFAAALRRTVRERRPDVVHAHVYASEVAAALATVGTGVPLVLTEHTEAPWRGRGAIWTSRWTYRRATRIHGVSGAIHRVLRDGHGIDAARLEHLPPAVVPAVGGGGALPARCVGRRVVARVARLQPEKGVDLFLRAAARVVPLVPDAHFLVVGDGPLRAQLEAQAAALGLEGHVTFLGQRPDARALLGGLDLLVVSSRSEGSPLVVLEANEAGVPVVATAVGGLPDQIEDGRDGVLVPPEDEEALADAVAGLLHDAGRARALAAGGRRRAAAWTHGRLVQRVEATYREALALRG